MKTKIITILLLTLSFALMISPVSAKIHIKEEVTIIMDEIETFTFVTKKDFAEVQLSVEFERGQTYEGLHVILRNELNHELFLRGYSAISVFYEVLFESEDFDIDLVFSDTYYLKLWNPGVSPALEVKVVLTELTTGDVVGIVLGAVTGVVVVIISFWIFYHFKDLRVGKKIEKK